jgi:hypothetical protein
MGGVGFMGGVANNVAMGGVTVNISGTAGESPDSFAKRVAQAVVDAQRMNLKSSGALLALP